MTMTDTPTDPQSNFREIDDALYGHYQTELYVVGHEDHRIDMKIVRPAETPTHATD